MEKCEHSSLLGGTFWDLDGCTGYYAMCGVCCLYGTGKTAHEVLEQFYPKEKTMSTDYDAGYKAGVETALDLSFQFSATYTKEAIKRAIDDQRQKLLTKKVTRYAIVCSRSRGEGNARAYYVCDDLYEGKGCAETEATFVRKRLHAGNKVHGVFPIEIEIPL